MFVNGFIITSQRYGILPMEVVVSCTSLGFSEVLLSNKSSEHFAVSGIFCTFAAQSRGRNSGFAHDVLAASVVVSHTIKIPHNNYTKKTTTVFTFQKRGVDMAVFFVWASGIAYCVRTPFHVLLYIYVGNSRKCYFGISFFNRI